MTTNTGGEETLSRRERERAAHRREIINAAVRVFARRGFGAATLDEVAQEAEFSKGALYLYFTGKEDILFNILYSMNTHSLEVFRKMLGGNRGFRDELRSLFLDSAEYAFSNSDMIKVVMAQQVAGFTTISEEGRLKLMGINSEVINIVRNRVRQAFEDGELRDISSEAITCMIYNSLNGLVSMRWNLESMEKARCAVDGYLDILFRGIAKEKENCA